MPSRACIVCERETSEAQLEEASVRSNVRAFKHETFAVWRCAHCASIHARDDVDLAHYYAKYPFHDLPVDWRLRAMYGRQLGRLRRSGLAPQHSILDYGCGGGHFVRYLRAQGYGNVRGFDAYSQQFADRAVLNQRFDCVFSQDVIEHVASPNRLLDEFESLTKTGSLIFVGTPNAAAIDLRRPEAYVHTLHAPYHRHILSKLALVRAAEVHGWQLDRYYSTMYSNTRLPFLNEAFYVYYARLADDTLDALMEPVRVAALLLRAPLTLFWGLFGSFFSRGTDVMAVFRRS
jgi:2-polyprenyl-3-methyl-5-hydroxy-6-metoxy-1,4-benzoquinol methylase